MHDAHPPSARERRVGQAPTQQMRQRIDRALGHLGRGLSAGSFLSARRLAGVSWPSVRHISGMSEFAVQTLLATPTVTIRDVYCRGSHRDVSPEECATATQLVFPYRGVYVRHLGGDQAVADANQVLFFNAGEGYRVSHPVQGGDASLTLIIDEPTLRELVPPARLSGRRRCACVPATPVADRSAGTGVDHVAAAQPSAGRCGAVGGRESRAHAHAASRWPADDPRAGVQRPLPATRGPGEARAGQRAGAAVDVG